MENHNERLNNESTPSYILNIEQSHFGTSTSTSTAAAAPSPTLPLHPLSSSPGSPPLPLDAQPASAGDGFHSLDVLDDLSSHFFGASQARSSPSPPPRLLDGEVADVAESEERDFYEYDRGDEQDNYSDSYFLDLLPAKSSGSLYTMSARYLASSYVGEIPTPKRVVSPSSSVSSLSASCPSSSSASSLSSASNSLNSISNHHHHQNNNNMNNNNHHHHHGSSFHQSHDEFDLLDSHPSTLPPSESIDWNEQHQQLTEEFRHAQLGRLEYDDLGALNSLFKRISVLYNDFDTHCEMYGRIIISEACLPPHQKTIRPVDVGGFAGGDKYIVKNIFFKFADARSEAGRRLYPSDECAMKVAGHELRALVSLQHASLFLRLPLHFPLMCLVDFKGHRVICQSIVPISRRDTLIYGSTDGGKTVCDGAHVPAPDPQGAAPPGRTFADVMRTLCQYLNLKPHRPRLNAEMLLDAPIDIEGHLGLDGRFYLLDVARLFPPKHFTAASYVQGCNLWSVLRPELVHGFRAPLSSDALSNFQHPFDRARNDQEVQEATQHLTDAVLPRFALRLDNQYGWALLRDHQQQALRQASTAPSYLSSQQSSLLLCSLLHQEGINLRFLGRLRALCSHPKNKLQILLEILARTIKNELRMLLRQSLGQGESAQNRLVLRTLRSVIGTHKEAAAFWARIRPSCERRFPGGFSAAEMDPAFDIRRALSFAASAYATPSIDSALRVLVQRVQHICGIRLSFSTFGELMDKPLSRFEYTSADLRGFIVTFKSQMIPSLATAVVLHRKGQRHVGSTGSDRLLNLAVRKFQEALQRQPNNFIAAKIYAVCLEQTALQKLGLERIGLFSRALELLVHVGVAHDVLKLTHRLEREYRGSLDIYTPGASLPPGVVTYFETEVQETLLVVVLKGYRALISDSPSPNLKRDLAKIDRPHIMRRMMRLLVLGYRYSCNRILLDEMVVIYHRLRAYSPADLRLPEERSLADTLRHLPDALFQDTLQPLEFLGVIELFLQATHASSVASLLLSSSPASPLTASFTSSASPSSSPSSSLTSLPPSHVILVSPFDNWTASPPTPIPSSTPISIPSALPSNESPTFSSPSSSSSSSSSASSASSFSDITLEIDSSRLTFCTLECLTSLCTLPIPFSLRVLRLDARRFDALPSTVFHTLLKFMSYNNNQNNNQNNQNNHQNNQNNHNQYQNNNILGLHKYIVSPFDLSIPLPPSLHLTELDLSGSSGLCDTIVARLIHAAGPELLRLSLRRVSRIAAATFAAIACTPTLQTLDLSATGAYYPSSLLTDTLPALSRLTQLNVSQTPLSGAGLRGLGPILSSLQTLKLARCRLLQSPDLAFLAEHLLDNRLAELDISCLSGDDIPLSRIADYTHSLRLLDVSGLPIKDESLALFVRNNPHLTSLQLNGCPLLTSALLFSLAPQLANLRRFSCDRFAATAVASLLPTFPEPSSFRLHLPAPDWLLQPLPFRLWAQLQRLSVPQCALLTDPFLAECLRSLPNLRQLVVDYCYALTDASLEAIAENCRLECLSARDCFRMTDQGFINLFEKTVFKRLFLSNCQISDRAIAKLASSSLFLSRLDLSRCEKLTDSALVTLSKKCRMLKRVYLSGCNISDEGLGELLDHCIKITHLHVQQCYRISSQSLSRVLLLNLKHLEFLNISFTNIGDRTFTDLDLTNSASEVALSASPTAISTSTTTINATAAAAPVAGGFLSKLLFLSIRRCSSLTPTILEHMALGALPLSTLVLSNPEISNETILAIVSVPSRLQVLDVSNSSLEDPDFEQLFLRLPHLIDFRARRCRGLVGSLVSLVQSCPNIVALDFTECVNMTSQSLTALTTKMAQLQMLKLQGCSGLDHSQLFNLLNQPDCRLLHLELGGRDCHHFPPYFLGLSSASMANISFSPRSRSNTASALRSSSIPSLNLRTALPSSLTHLTLAHSHGLDFGTCENMLRQLSHLETLILDFSDISTETLQSLARYCHSLRRLSLIGCRNIIGWGILGLCYNSPFLLSVDISLCHNIPFECSERILQHFNSIKLVRTDEASQGC